jgi:hypothetical protein
MFPDTYAHASSLRVHSTHQTDLVVTFIDIALVDTDSIDPQSSFETASPELAESFVTVDGDRDVLVDVAVD